MRDIDAALQEHYNAVIEYGIPASQIIGVFLYGSQNYGVATEDSDVDTRAIIVPTLYECIFNKPLVKTLHLADGEHCEIMDIREYVNNLKKQNMNFVECLFTRYYMIGDPCLFHIFRDEIIYNGEELAHYNIYYGVRSMVGQALHTIYEDPRDGKKIGNAYRIYNSLLKYISGYRYEDCLINDVMTNEIVISYKLHTAELINDDVAKTLIHKLERLEQETIQHVAEVIEPQRKEELDTMLKNTIYKMVKETV